ncbi:hypothetical protein J1605_006151 [Eschrichtius robustus]|uniref:Uncharacterized protein n=1 Tax=Eschrichtius robustus TaxID=9764 RepID=A0AB34H1L7_ESCRO|nr:hypothetical protein J1605_006151 [Eschrichtius robustus]
MKREQNPDFLSVVAVCAQIPTSGAWRTGRDPMTTSSRSLDLGTVADCNFPLPAFPSVEASPPGQGSPLSSLLPSASVPESMTISKYFLSSFCRCQDDSWACTSRQCLCACSCVTVDFTECGMKSGVCVPGRGLGVWCMVV